jgi:hypothetical protein
MKKLIILSFLVLSTTFAFSNSNTDFNSNEASSRSAVLTQRISEINALDIKSLSRTERKTLKKEIKSINEEIKSNKGLDIDKKVSVSVGAIIIAVLLLIIIL